jgi:hypothetical protein
LPPTLIAFGRCTITSRPLQALRFELPVQAGAPIFRARAFPHRKFASVLEGGCYVTKFKRTGVTIARGQTHRAVRRHKVYRVVLKPILEAHGHRRSSESGCRDGTTSLELIAGAALSLVRGHVTFTAGAPPASSLCLPASSRFCHRSRQNQH